MKILRFFISVFAIYFVSLSCLHGQTQDVSTGQVYSLKSYIDHYISENKSFNVKNSNGLYSQLGDSAKTDLFDSALYSSLGYQLRKSIYSLPGELSGKLYKYNNPAMYTGPLESLEKSWAVLNSTKQRILQDDWIESALKANLTINAVKSWYINKNIPKYQRQLALLKSSVDLELEKISNKKQNYDADEWSGIAILLSKFKSDIATLNQFYFSEQAKLYTHTGMRNISVESESKDFLQVLQCSAKDPVIDIEGVPGEYTKELKSILNSNLENKEAIWTINKLSKKVSLNLLSSPSDIKLKSVRDFLSKEVSKRLFELNNTRYRSFDREPDSFFQETSAVNASDLIKQLQGQLYTTYFNTLRDIFYADEQAAFLKLNWAKNCQNEVGSDNGTTKKKLASKAVEKKEAPVSIVQAVKESSKDGVSVVPEEIAAAKVSTDTGNKSFTKKNISYLNDFESAVKELAKYRVDLISNNDLKRYLNGHGYSILLLSTRYANKVNTYVNKYGIENELFIYLKAVRNKEGEVENQYTVLAGLHDADSLDEEGFIKLFKKSKKLKGKLVTYKNIRAGLN